MFLSVFGCVLLNVIYDIFHSCSGVCSDFRKTAHFQCQSGSLCDSRVNDHEQAKCTGVIRDCENIDDSDVNICETVS